MEYYLDNVGSLDGVQQYVLQLVVKCWAGFRMRTSETAASRTAGEGPSWWGFWGAPVLQL